MGKKGDLSDFERGMVVGARRAGLSISKTADLLGFSLTTISRVYREWSEKEKISSKRQLCLRKCLVDIRGQRRMGRLVRDDRNATVTQITTRYNQEHESMGPSCLVSMVQAGSVGVMVWGIFSWHTLGPLVPIEHHLNTTAYLSIVADHVHPFMTTVYPSSDGYFQQDNAPCHNHTMSLCLPVCYSVCVSTALSIFCLVLYLSVYLPFCHFITLLCLSVTVSLLLCQFVCHFVCLSMALSVCLSLYCSYLSVCLSVTLLLYNLSVCLLCLSVYHFVCVYCYLS
uniref:Tc3 transposase DNA binding domain-containing protein n=1 Tax=Cyprinus carpio carpio TaxID=630221 RepID=A0A9J7X6Q2_CYPCA